MKVPGLPVILLVALSSTAVFGQKENGMFDSQEEYGQFMGAAKRASADNPELRALIPLINDIAQGRSFGSTAQQYGIAGSNLGLLSDARIREDIEMVDDQYNDLRDRQSEIQKRLASQLRSIDFTDSKNIAGEIAKIRDEAENDLNSVLLPHQVKRLRQIRMQSALRGRSLVDVITNDPVKSDLEITDGQTKDLRAFEKEVQQDLQKEIVKLQEKARDRLISKLKPEQRTPVKEMLGDTFEFRDPVKGKPKAAKGQRGGKRK